MHYFHPSRTFSALIIQVKIAFAFPALSISQVLSTSTILFSEYLTSMRRLSDIPDKNTAIIWWTGKDVIINWAHWKAVHCIFMGKHIQGLGAGRKTQFYLYGNSDKAHFYIKILMFNWGKPNKNKKNQQLPQWKAM